MQTAPLNWSSLFSSSHRVEYKFVIDGVDYLTNDVKGIPQIRKPLMENFSIGEFASASATVEIYPKGIISRAAPVNVYCRLVSLDGNTVTDWVEQGHFFIMSRSERNGITTLTCQDAAVKAGQSYTDKTQFTEWPVPMADVVNEIASIMGVEIDPRTVIQTGSDYKVSYPNEDMLMSEVLRMIAAAHGGNWILTESGKLRLVVYGDPANAPTIEGHYQRFSPLAKTVELSRVTLTDDAGNQFTVGDDTGDELTAECFYATQAVVNALDPRIDFNNGQGVLRLLFGSFNKGILYLNDTDDTAVVSENGRINISGSGVTFGNLKYLPYTLEGAYIDPLLELGDFLSLDFRGKTYTVYVNSIDLRCTVGYSANLALKVKDGTDNEYPYTRAKDLAASRYVSTSHTYHGNRINRSEGFVSEYMVNDTPVARLIANSNIFSMQQLVNGAWENRIYFDAIARKYKITGDVTVEGALTADVLKTSGAVEISGDNITTGTISAARLDLSGVEGAIASIRSDLEGLTTSVQEVEEVAIASVVVQYALGTSSSTAPDSGWSATAPAWESGKYMWQRTVTTYADSTVEEPHVSISDPTCIQGAKGQDGAPGTNAYNTALVYLYKRSATVPTVDWTNALTYNFTNKALTSVPDGWSATVPSGTSPLYVTTATAYSNTETDSIAASEWSSPVVLAQNGSSGTNGLNAATVFLYQRKNGEAPAKPSSALTYTFSTGRLSGTLGDWSQTVPASNGSPCYVTQATASSRSSSVSIAASAWSAPVILVEDGADGAKGDDGVGIESIVTEYYLANSSYVPTGEETTGWVTTPPAWESGKKIWTRSHITWDNGTESYTDPECNNTVTSFGEKYSEVKQTADKINWLVASGTTAANFTMTSRAISQVAQTLTLTAVSHESPGGQSIGALIAGTSTPTDGSAGYAFSTRNVNNIWEYTSSNAGVDNSVCYGKLLFNQSEDTEITLECISCGENNYDFGIISNIDSTLGVTRSLDSSGVFHSFKGESSETPQKLTMTIPAGSHFITFKYVKDGSTSSGGDYFKLKLYTNPVIASTLTLKSNNTTLTSANITFTGLVTFTDLEQTGRTQINGANITTGKISAERIDVTGIHVDEVYHNDYLILTTKDVNGYTPIVKLGITNLAARASVAVTQIHGDVIAFCPVDTDEYDDYCLTVSLSAEGYISPATRSSYKWNLGGTLAPFAKLQLGDYSYLWFDESNSDLCFTSNGRTHTIAFN